MVRLFAVATAVACIVLPDLASAQSKPKEAPIAASRFGISIDGVQIDGTKKPKAKGLKSSRGTKGGSTQNAKPAGASPKKAQ